MINKILQKIKPKILFELAIGLFVLSIPFFISSYKIPESFEFKTIENEKLFILPNEKEKPILDLLDSAKENIDITIYLLSNKKIKNKLIEIKKNKNIHIRIILEEHPFGGGGTTEKDFIELKNAGIDIKYSSKDFSLTHAKYIIIDKKRAFIMTCNLTKSGLNDDRDFIIFESDPEIVNELNNIFEADFEYKNYSPKIDNLVVSPSNSRYKIEALLKSAKNKIYIYAENISDDSIESILKEKSLSGVEIRIILPDSKILKSNEETIAILNSIGAKTSFLKKPYQHAKIIIIDDSIMYLGSINFSKQSMDKNREIGIITMSKNIIDSVINTFNNDFK